MDDHSDEVSVCGNCAVQFSALIIWKDCIYMFEMGFHTFMFIQILHFLLFGNFMSLLGYRVVGFDILEFHFSVGIFYQ